jgi:hypothetical protein
MKLIKETDKALLWKSEGEQPFYEVWIALLRTVGHAKGTLIEPADEDFGVSAWCFTSYERALKCFDEITTGKRVITPMLEAEVN